MIQPLQTRPHNQPMMYPIQSQQQYKLETLQNKKLPASYIAGTSGEVLLHKQLLKECQATSKLIQLSNQIRTQFPSKKERLQDQHSKTHKKSKKRPRAVSSHSSKKIPSKKPRNRKTSTSSSTSSDSSNSNSSTTSSD